MNVKTGLKAGNLFDFVVDEYKREALAAAKFLQNANSSANQLADNAVQSVSSMWNSLAK